MSYSMGIFSLNLNTLVTVPILSILGCHKHEVLY